MITEDQAGVIDLLSTPSAHGGAVVQRIDTHASIVFLAGSRAYKLTRAVTSAASVLSSARDRVGDHSPVI